MLPRDHLLGVAELEACRQHLGIAEMPEARQVGPDLRRHRIVALAVPAQNELRLLLEILDVWHRRTTDEGSRRWALPLRLKCRCALQEHTENGRGAAAMQTVCRTRRTCEASALFLDLGKRGNIPQPLLLRAAPDLPLRYQLIALAHGADADVVDLRPIAGRCCIDWRSAARTESLYALAAALPGLHINGGLARQNTKAMVRRRDRDSKRGARQHLAVGAVTDRGALRIDISRIGDVAAVAASVDFHLPPLHKITNKITKL